LARHGCDLSKPSAAPQADEASARKRTIEEGLRSERRAVLVVNTRSRRGRELFADARRQLAERGIALHGAYAVRNPARLPEIVRAALEQGPRLVIVGGGDGTVSSVVGYFAYRDAVLGILPLGTANSFARAVGIPLDLDAAIDVAVAGKVADVDLGQINDEYFANAAAIGLPASIARHMPALLKRWLGRAGYLIVAAVRLLRHRSFRCTIRANGASSTFDALEVRVANGEYQGGVRVAGEASVESCDLVVQYIKGNSRYSVARFWWRAGLGLNNGSEDVQVLRADHFALDCAPRQYVSIDGEPVTRTPVRARVARQALLLMVPRDQADVA
jgi:YegS/Rv2252/BmrU family lipid kinase